jgi:hypothetical protein
MIKTGIKFSFFVVIGMGLHRGPWDAFSYVKAVKKPPLHRLIETPGHTLF